MYMPKIKDKSALIISILIPIAIGALSALFSNNMSSYATLVKPPLSPPSFIFPIVWTILFILMGISSYTVYKSEDSNRNKALFIYGLQLIFNFFWSIIFFGFSQFLFALIWLIILIVIIIFMIVNFYKISPLSTYLQIPYLLWCLFATYLNFMIFVLNK